MTHLTDKTQPRRSLYWVRVGMALSLVALALLVTPGLRGQAETNLTSAGGLTDLAKNHANDKANKVQQLNQEADLAKAQYQKNPQDGNAATALQTEAKKRLIAGLLDTGAVKTDVVNLAETARQDSRLTAAQRFELASLEEMATRKGNKYKNNDDLLQDREASARRLIAAYPDVPEAQGCLLQVAALQRGARRTALAQEVLNSAAPAAIKDSARTLILRESLAGSLLQPVLQGTPGAARLLSVLGKQPLVFYTWRPENQDSLDRAKVIAKALPKSAVTIGINLSRDLAAALTAARNLPGEQLGGGSGYGHPVALSLGLTAPSMLYAVGTDGRIQNLSDEANVPAVLAKLN